MALETRSQKCTAFLWMKGRLRWSEKRHECHTTLLRGMRSQRWNEKICQKFLSFSFFERFCVRDAEWQRLVQFTNLIFG